MCKLARLTEEYGLYDMPKIELRTAIRPHKSSGRAIHYVELLVDGVIFETQCTAADKAQDLVIKTARALGVAYKKEE
jgi:hypothetical protein